MAAESSAGGGMPNPMHQFEITKIVDLDLGFVDASFTNSALFMVLTVIAVVGFLMFAMSNRSIIPGRMQSVAELAYEFVANMIRSNTGSEGMKYFPFVFTLFIFILVANLLGMIAVPFVPVFNHPFTVTSHIIVTFALAALVFVVVTGIGFARHGIGYLKLFVPHGVPIWLLPFIVVIELISYLIRPISLSVRLFANMMAGHTLLKVFASFIGMLGTASALFIVPAMVAFTGLEFLVAFLQAFIFSVLTCIYLNDAINMHEH